MTHACFLLDSTEKLMKSFWMKVNIKVDILPNGVFRCLSASHGVSWCLLVSKVLSWCQMILLMASIGFSCCLWVLESHSILWCFIVACLVVSHGVS